MNRIDELIAERKRINKEINALRKNNHTEQGIKLEKYPTGKLSLKLMPFGLLAPSRFVTVAEGYSEYELRANADAFVRKIEEFFKESVNFEEEDK